MRLPVSVEASVTTSILLRCNFSASSSTCRAMRSRSIAANFSCCSGVKRLSPIILLIGSFRREISASLMMPSPSRLTSFTTDNPFSIASLIWSLFLTPFGSPILTPRFSSSTLTCGVTTFSGMTTLYPFTYEAMRSATSAFDNTRTGLS